MRNKEKRMKKNTSASGNDIMEIPEGEKKKKKEFRKNLCRNNGRKLPKHHERGEDFHPRISMNSI